MSRTDTKKSALREEGERVLHLAQKANATRVGIVFIVVTLLMGIGLMWASEKTMVELALPGAILIASGLGIAVMLIFHNTKSVAMGISVSRALCQIDRNMGAVISSMEMSSLEKEEEEEGEEDEEEDGEPEKEEEPQMRQRRTYSLRSSKKKR